MKNRIVIVCAVAVAALIAWASIAAIPRGVEQAIGFRLPSCCEVVSRSSGGYSQDDYFQWVVINHRSAEWSIRSQLLVSSSEVYLPDGADTLRKSIQIEAPGVFIPNGEYNAFVFLMDRSSRHEIEVGLLVGIEKEFAIISRRRK